MKNMTIKSKLLFIFIVTIILVATMIAIKSIYSLNSLTKENIAQYKQNAYAVEKESLESYTKFARNIIENYYEQSSIDVIKKNAKERLVQQTNFLFKILDKLYSEFNGKVSDAELQKILIDAIAGARYGKSGYFFVYNENAVVLKHPINPTKEGKRYPKPHILNFIKLAIDHGEGLVSYEQTVPNKPPRQKVAYVKYFKKFKWIIGTGAYLDDVSETLKQKALDEIAELRFGKNGYFFIYDYNGVNLMHPTIKEHIGKNLLEAKTKKGIYFIKELIKAAKKGGDIVTYDYPKPGSKVDSEKIGYATGFEPWKWMIGTGVYTDKIEEHIANLQAESNDKITSIVLGILLISVIVSVLIALFVVYFINTQINKPLTKFQVGLLDFFKYLSKEKDSIDKIDINSKDEIGQMAKVVNDNIEKTNKLLDQDFKLIDNVKQIVTEVNHGSVKNRLQATTENKSLEELKTNLNEMLTSISTKVNDNFEEIDKALHEFSNMNFTYRINNPKGEVAKGLNLLADTINDMLVQNKQSGINLRENSQNLLNTVTILSTASNESASSLEETAAALEEITSNVVSNSENISKMVQFANRVSGSANDGERLADKTSVSMDSINEQTQAIAEAITVIDQIAFQTNILSLNAAVEAATAGEAGKGFAVVAQEVRNLASRSAEAAKEIKELVENATLGANEGKAISSEMIKGYHELKSNIDETLRLISDVETSSKEQRAGIEQINDTINDLDQQTQKNASVASQTNDIAIETEKIATKILEDVEEKKFIEK
ncbi:chemotaxis protein [Arcobacter sp. CECT 8986]|uniref:methyl-accepting chemotaxis protein n=1 Tax=Arcobacter sp. CECT 8986 TaxID=2044507 RepID=UPI001009C7E4|nr:cache domain-containing protein [Arcobacter sp. CECT 8986]RXJ99505.1 chemotaxis protein [Arcobacter sp. CECT 8986]